MSVEHSTHEVFGPFEVDLQTQELKRHGVRLRLPRQSFQILAMLLQRPGQLIPREELQLALWPSDTFVAFEKGLNAAVNRLREALGDSSEKPRYVETLPRRGYRFIGTVDNPIFQAPVAPKGRFQELTARARWISVAATLLALLGGLGIWLSSRNRSQAAPRGLEVVPLAGLDGAETEPAFSPDGNQVAFALHNQKSPGIYTTLVAGGTPLRLTTDPSDGSPRWSRDGQHIAFTRRVKEGVAIYQLSALGGIERRLYSGPATAFSPAFDWCGWRIVISTKIP